MFAKNTQMDKVLLLFIGYVFTNVNIYLFIYVLLTFTIKIHIAAHNKVNVSLWGWLLAETRENVNKRMRGRRFNPEIFILRSRREYTWRAYALSFSDVSRCFWKRSLSEHLFTSSSHFYTPDRVGEQFKSSYVDFTVEYTNRVIRRPPSTSPRDPLEFKGPESGWTLRKTHSSWYGFKPVKHRSGNDRTDAHAVQDPT